MSRKPDFFIVGAPKAGTSSLYNYLIQHPGVFMSYPKEPHFFYNRSTPGSPVLQEKALEDYLGLFTGVSKGVCAGEASTSYLWSASTASEIKHLQPEAKIIILLRDPVDRAYSHYWHQVQDGIEPLDFEEALQAEPERIRQGRWHGLYYVDNGLYAGQVRRYLEVFGQEAVRVYLFEDLIRDTREVCRDVFEFLGLDPDVPLETEKIYNQGGAPRSKMFARLVRMKVIKEPLKSVLPTTVSSNLGEWLRTSNNKPVPAMEPKTEARLRAIFDEDVVRLEGLIGRDLSYWRA